KDDGATLNGGVDTDPTPNTITVSVTPVNDPPVSIAGTVTGLEETTYTFTLADFNFSDPSDAPNSNSLQAVKIATIPTIGGLTLSGQPVTAATPPISTAVIAGGQLRYTPVTNGFGPAYASFTWKAQDNGGTA